MSLLEIPDQLKNAVAQQLQLNPQLSTLELATQFQQPEGKIILALPTELVSIRDGKYAYEILQQLPNWGVVVTILEKEGSIFEIKQPFPFGKNGYGYYNLNLGSNTESGLHGHLKLENIAKVALISKPFKGKESYAFVFISQAGTVIFKIYLGRDEHRQLLPEQVNKFKQLLTQ
ncbi:heme utilization cystosolic carrier protein HutX [Avibacterium sp. 21-586]|uniref:heme utilization cystosolic carrier protein HutX n=1 Tax=Avibacterium sp. 21-586 TaxID=2911534 RepID=UPI0022476347|nr:heme utilization cystosolic carrier protein HutX [Avibacterium sp. 21-586]MCW9710282.1 heme utilization cystosolic carrier protein HutX [Avibacterium sp. 21-586]